MKGPLSFLCLFVVLLFSCDDQQFHHVVKNVKEVVVEVEEEVHESRSNMEYYSYEIIVEQSRDGEFNRIVIKRHPK